MKTLERTSLQTRALALIACVLLAVGVACAGTMYAHADDTAAGVNGTAQTDTVTVTFDKNGGTGTMEAQKVKADTDTALTANKFTREGYEFAGWSVTKTGKDKDGKAAKAYADKAKVKLSKDTTLYAQWKEKAASSSSATTETKGATQAATVTTPAANGVVGQVDTYTVTFNKNASDATGTMTAQTFNAGVAANLTPNAFDRDNYLFDGWNTEADGSGMAYADEASYPGDADATLYAQWQAIPPTTYTVTFNANGGTGTMDAQTFTENSPAALNANTFTRDNYLFDGWNTKADGTGTAYDDKAQYTATAETGDTTLYAQWFAIPPTTYTVTFNANGGTGTMDAQTFTENSPAALNANTFTHSGYTFSGWNTKADGSGAGYADKAQYTATADITLYAQWTETPVMVAVSFDANGGSGKMADQEVTAGKDATIAANNFTREGYSFNGWNTVADGSGTSYADKATINTKSALTLYAQWTPNTYTVSFDANGGSGSMSDQEFTYGESQALNANKFTRSGYTFNGWNTQKDGKGTSYSDKATIKVSQDTKLYAQWKANSSSSKTSTSSTSKSSAKTGDTTNVLPLVGLAVIAACIAAFALVRKNRSKKGDSEQS